MHQTSEKPEQVKVPFGDLRLDYAAHKIVIDAAVHNVLEKGWFVLGDAGRAFEAAFAQYCGVPFGLGVGSGTEALHLALIALGIQPGDEVLTVANTCAPTLSAISFAGAMPIFVDIDPLTQTMDPARIEERLTLRTRAILPVHLYGQCADMDPILEIARENDLSVVEDCAQAHGASYKGRMAGTMGDAGCYSFYPSKNLGAYGDAGIIICSDPALADMIRMIRNYGEQKRYYHLVKGFNSRLDELQAAVLLAKLPGLEAANARRRTIAEAYTERLSQLGNIICPQEAAGRHHAYHLYVIRVQDRPSFRQHLSSRGISTLIHYPVPMHRQDAYRECLDQAEFLPVTDQQSEQIVSLPIYPQQTDAQVEQVIEAVESYAVSIG